jgi:hypothetical protein
MKFHTETKGHGRGNGTNVSNQQLIMGGNKKILTTNKTKQTLWPLVRKRTILTERLPLVGEI